jgi:hypothetical protein
MMSLSLLAVDLWRHSLRSLSLSLLGRVNLTGPVCVGGIFGWPEWDTWCSNSGSWGTSSEPVVTWWPSMARTHRCRGWVLTSASSPLICLLIAVRLAARPRLSLRGRLRTIGSCRPTLREHRVGCLLVLALLLDSVLLRIVLALLV